MQVIAIANQSTLGRKKGRQARKIRTLLTRQTEIDLHLTPNRQTAAALIEKIHSREKLLVISIGGDGTTNGLISKLIGRKNATLALVPLGTANDLARSLGITSPRAACRLISQFLENPDQQDHCHRTLDVISVNYGRLYGLVSVGVGIAPLIAQKVAQSKKWAISYHWAVLQCLSRCRPVPIELKIGSFYHLQAAVLLGAACNTPLAGKFPVAPRALLNDGQLDLCLVGRMPYWKKLLYALAASQGWHTRLPETVFLRTQELTFSSPEPLWVQVDGELLKLPEGRPLHLSIIHNCLRVLAPKKPPS